MTLLNAQCLASVAGISVQAARGALRRAAHGQAWRGHSLPVVAVDGQRGGAGGKVQLLDVGNASPGLLALLGLAGSLASTPLPQVVPMRPDDRHFAVARDRLRVIDPILREAKRSPERAAAVTAAAALQHRIGDGWTMVKERTVREWVSATAR